LLKIEFSRNSAHPSMLGVEREDVPEIAPTACQQLHFPSLTVVVAKENDANASLVFRTWSGVSGRGAQFVTRRNCSVDSSDYPTCLAIAYKAEIREVPLRIRADRLFEQDPRLATIRSGEHLAKDVNPAIRCADELHPPNAIFW